MSNFLQIARNKQHFYALSGLVKYRSCLNFRCNAEGDVVINALGECVLHNYL